MEKGPGGFAYMTDSAAAKTSVEARLQKLTAELQDLERVLMSGSIDARVLREFRDAVDHVRKAAWAVQEWQERQAHARDTSTVLPLLMFERVRRATQLCNAIASDMEKAEAASESLQTDELSHAMESLQKRIEGRRT